MPGRHHDDLRNHRLPGLSPRPLGRFLVALFVAASKFVQIDFVLR